MDWEIQISTKAAWQLQAENPAGTAGGRFPWKGMRYAFLRASLQPGVSHIDPVYLSTHPSIWQLCPRHWGSTSEPPALLPLTCEHLSRVGTGRALELLTGVGTPWLTELLTTQGHSCHLPSRS